MDLSDDEIQQHAEADRREVDPPIQIQTATWSTAGQLDWWVKERREWFGRVRSDRPLEVGGKASAARIEGATLKVYPSVPNGITDTNKEQLNADLLPFVQGTVEGSTSPAMSVTTA